MKSLYTTDTARVAQLAKPALVTAQKNTSGHSIIYRLLA